MPELNFNLLAPTSQLYSGPQVQMDPVAAYEKAKATRQSNMLAELYAKHYDPQTGGVNYNALIPEAAQSGLDVTAIMPDVQKQQVSQAQVQHYQSLSEQEKAAANLHDVEAKQKEADAKHADIARAIGDIAKYRDKPAAMNGIEQKFEEGKIDKEAYDNLMNMVRNEPSWAKSQRSIINSLMSAKEQLDALQSQEPKPEKVDVGGSIKIIDMNPNSQTYMKEIKSLTKSATPVQELINERLSKSGVNAASYPLVAQAIADGLLSPDRVNSRNVSILESAARVAQEKGQSLDFNQLAGQGTLARNPAFQQKAMAVESIPEVISKVAEAGKKLNFSDNLKAVADIQKWYAGQIQDPKLTEYMTLRNDSLMSIAYAMRQAGMSDYATRMEAEAASPSMSPKQLDAWVSAQMKALEPRLKQYRSVSVTGSKTATPPVTGGGAQTPKLEDPLGIRKSQAK